MQNTEAVMIVEGKIALAVYFETLCLLFLTILEFIFNFSLARNDLI